MSLRSPAPAQARGLVLLLLTAVVAVVACGGSSASPSPSTASGASAGPSEPAASEAPSQAPSTAPSEGASGGPVDFGDAATKLSTLDSYKFTVEIQSSESAGSGTTPVSAGTTSFSGTVINSPEKAQTLEMVTKDADGNVTDANSFILLPGKAYTKSGADGKWEEIPAAQADLYIQALGSFRPESMFAMYFAAAATDNVRVGDETKNGVAATHFRGGDAMGAILGALAGVNGQWSSDVWLAKDGDYLVHSEASVAAATATSGGSFSIVVDITDINSSSNVVAAPM